MQAVVEGYAPAQPRASGETSPVGEVGMGGFCVGLLWQHTSRSSPLYQPQKEEFCNKQQHCSEPTRCTETLGKVRRVTGVQEGGHTPRDTQ